MRWSLALFLLAMVGCQAAPDNITAPACALPTPTVIETSGDPHGPNGRLLQVWDVADNPVLWSKATPVGGGYADFRAKLAQSGETTDPLELLAANPTPNNKLVAANAASWISPAGCLEKLMVGLQHERRDIFMAPTEFANIVMRSADGARLRIYFFTINQDGIGRMSPLTNPALADAANGWSVMLAMHTHAFHQGNAQLNGIVSPSTPDADFQYNFAEEAGLEQSWITNGVSTVRIPAAEFGSFERK